MKHKIVLVVRCEVYVIKSSVNRQIKVNHRLKSYRRRAWELLNSEKGHYYRISLSVFGNIKHSKGFRLFSLRGK